MGAPFTTRLVRGNLGGLQYPKDLTESYTFVCELCSVRSVVGRELHGSAPDRVLLVLERMRMIDTASSLAPPSRYSNSLSLRHVSDFRKMHGIPSSTSRPLLRPPTSSATSVMWAMEQRVLQPSTKRNQTITFNAARQLRSGTSTWDRWENAMRFPESTTVEVPTDSVLTSYCIKGMKRRLGTKSTPSMALRQHHVLFNQERRGERYHHPTITLLHRYEQAGANVAELFAWLGWLRGGEIFLTDWSDVEYAPPSPDGGRYGLPPRAGAILLSLTPETKCNANVTADVVMAWATSGGFRLGYWLTQLADIALALGWHTGPIFRTAKGRRWTSRHFRTEHCWPLLEEQRGLGDAMLQMCDDTPGNTIPDKFWSMHMYRRGANSHVKRHRPGCVRAATTDEINEHGRWRARNTGSEGVATHYTDLPVEDRLYITLFCH